MSISLIGSIQTRESASQSITSLGLQKNDIVFVASTHDFRETDLTISGYTPAYDIREHLGLVNMCTSILQYKIMGSTPDTTVSGLNTDTQCCHIIFALRGVDKRVIGTAYDYNYDSANLPNPPDVTTKYGNSWVIAGGHLDDDMISMTAPSGFTLIDAYYSSVAGASVAVAYKLQGTPTTVSIGSFGGAGDDANIGASFELRKLSTNNGFFLLK